MEGIHLDTLQAHPCKGRGVVEGGVDVFGGIALGDTLRVVGHSQFRIGQEMLSARQETIACCGSSHIHHALRQRWQVFTYKRRYRIVCLVLHGSINGSQRQTLCLHGKGLTSLDVYLHIRTADIHLIVRLFRLDIF